MILSGPLVVAGSCILHLLCMVGVVARDLDSHVGALYIGFIGRHVWDGQILRSAEEVHDQVCHGGATISYANGTWGLPKQFGA